MQPATRSPGEQLALGQPRRIHREVCVESDECVQLRVELCDASQQRLQQLDRRQFASGVCGSDLAGREPVKLRHRLSTL